mmetsp:Transcript_68190/g.154270  ORF Transcript_68190/g.154270 Transcript_68190/m.154270 type:complete len:476 (+) Transcript_68190:14-1441(+)
MRELASRIRFRSRTSRISTVLCLTGVFSTQTDEVPFFGCDFSDEVQLWLDWPPTRHERFSVSVHLGNFSSSRSWDEFATAFDSVFYNACTHYSSQGGALNPPECTENLERQLYRRILAVCEDSLSRQARLAKYLTNAEKAPCRFDGATTVSHATIADQAIWLPILHYSIIPARENSTWHRYYDDLARFIATAFVERNVLSKTPQLATNLNGEGALINAVVPAHLGPGDTFDVRTPRGASASVVVPENTQGGSQIRFFAPLLLSHQDQSPLRVVEVGTAYGGLSSLLLSWFPTAQVFSIDPFIVDLDDIHLDPNERPLADAIRAAITTGTTESGYHEEGVRPSAFDFGAYERFSRNWAWALYYDHLRQGFGCRYHLIREPPMQSTAGRFADGSLDILIIDASPSYDFVSTVTRFFFGKLRRPGGVLVFVGYGTPGDKNGGLREAVNEISASLGVKIALGDLGVPPGKGNAAIVLPS